MLPEGRQSHHHRVNGLLKLVAEHNFLSQIIQKENKCRVEQHKRQINAQKKTKTNATILPRVFNAYSMKSSTSIICFCRSNDKGRVQRRFQQSRGSNQRCNALGWLNWFVIPLAVLGLVPGLLSPASSGSTINLVVIVMGVVRLILGGGIL